MNGDSYADPCHCDYKSGKYDCQRCNHQCCKKTNCCNQKPGNHTKN